jgi:hypothetical protein
MLRYSQAVFAVHGSRKKVFAEASTFQGFFQSSFVRATVPLSSKVSLLFGGARLGTLTVCKKSLRPF